MTQAFSGRQPGVEEEKEEALALQRRVEKMGKRWGGN